MSNQFLCQKYQLQQEQTLEHFDSVINSIYVTYQKQQIPDTLTKLKPLINNHKKFANVINEVIHNSKYHYKEHNYANFNLLINEVIREFNFSEQLFLIANIDLYGLTHNDKTTELLKSFMCKILRDKLIAPSTNVN